jgi:MATE family multidrug resistance protein
MCVALGAYLAWDARRRRTRLFQTSLAPDWPRLRRLATLGFPAAAQRGLEIGVFATATMLIGRLSPESLAAHQVALNAASVTFMVPLGISSAAAVRVGQALGRRDAEWAHLSGWMALWLGGVFMALAGLCFLIFPEEIVRLFSEDEGVIAIGVRLLYIAALFQLFDGFQVVATGALRGAGDTRTPMLANLVGHWLLGLPVGWWLCFRMEWGAPGIWTGLSTGLIFVGAVLAYFWSTRLEQFQADTAA